MPSINFSYTLVPKAPSAMGWSDYADRVVKEWQALLASNDAGDESKVQAFLETHPCLIPQPTQFIGNGQAPHPWALIAQPPLVGTTAKRIPDFMWITANSATLFFTFIEIEAPTKRVFRNDGIPTAEFTEAKNQIDEWRVLSKNSNLTDQFRTLFKIPDRLWSRRAKRFRFYLIMGRRKELNSHSDLVNEKRVDLLGPDAEHITFDRLEPERRAENMLCVGVTNGRMTARSVPPTYHHSPFYALSHAHIAERDKAIERSNWMSPKRRKFLIDRLPYWDNWVFNQHNHALAPGDRE